MTPDQLTALADKIDRRLGPVSGRDADEIAVALRHAAEQIAGIRHPTGSEKFAAALTRFDMPAPWRLCDEEVGEVLADNGAIVFQVGGNHKMSDADISALALWIIVAVNTCAGFKAETVEGG